jgi:hypothetical protein
MLVLTMEPLTRLTKFMKEEKDFFAQICPFVALTIYICLIGTFAQTGIDNFSDGSYDLKHPTIGNKALFALTITFFVICMSMICYLWVTQQYNRRWLIRQAVL